MKGPLIVLLCIMVYVKGDEVSEVIANAKNHNYRFVIFSLKDELKLSVEATGNTDENIDDLIGKLPDNLPRHVLLDYGSNSPDDGSSQQNWLLVTWIPDGTKIKERMMYSSTIDLLKKRLDLQHIRDKVFNDKQEFKVFIRERFGSE